MSLIEQIKELDEQRAKLVCDAKADALSRIESAITDLKELGFDYQLVEGGRSASSSPRRPGVRQDVYDTIESNGPISRQDLMEAMGAKGNKSGEQSISNAIAALKRAGRITADDGIYQAKP